MAYLADSVGLFLDICRKNIEFSSENISKFYKSWTLVPGVEFARYVGTIEGKRRATEIIKHMNT